MHMLVCLMVVWQGYLGSWYTLQVRSQLSREGGSNVYRSGWGRVREGVSPPPGRENFGKLRPRLSLFCCF